MANQPRKDSKSTQVQEQAAAAARGPVAPADGASLDTFKASAAIPAVGSAQAAATTAKATVPLQEPATGDKPGNSAPQPPGATAPLAATAAATAATAANPVAAGADEARKAASDRFEPVVVRDTGGDQGPANEPSAEVAKHTDFDEGVVTRLTGAADAGLVDRNSEQDSGLTPFLNSGRAELVSQANDVFALEEVDGVGTSPGGVVSNAGAGGTFGQVGSPADLGVGGPGDSTSIGMDVFDTSIPTGGVSGAADDLAVMQGIVPQQGADPNATPSVADGKDVAIGLGLGVMPLEIGLGALAATSVASAVAIGAGGGLAMVALAGEAMGFNDAAATWAAENLTEEGRMAKEQEALAAKAQAEAAARDAKKAAEANASQPGKSDPGADPDIVGGRPTSEYMAWRAAARERLHIDSPLPGEGATDPGREGTEQAPSGPPVGHVEAGIAARNAREFLVGQPGEGVVRGSGTIDLGRLPGDMGNIDYGPDSTGAWSGNTRTEDEGDALDSLTGPGLSISDLNNNDDEEDDESDDSE